MYWILVTMLRYARLFFYTHNSSFNFAFIKFMQNVRCCFLVQSVLSIFFPDSYFFLIYFLEVKPGIYFLCSHIYNNITNPQTAMFLIYFLNSAVSNWILIIFLVRFCEFISIQNYQVAIIIYPKMIFSVSQV